MQRILSLIILALLTFQNVFSQKIFDLKISLDDSIDSRKVSYSYHNGKRTYSPNDTFANNALQLKGKYYSELVYFRIQYDTNDSVYYVNEFFLNESPAEISFYFDGNTPDRVLKYDRIVNATPVFDTSVNKLSKGLIEHRRKVSQKVSELWDSHGSGIFRNDSLMALWKKFYRELNDVTISFLERYPQDYFSFWYFQNQVVRPSLSFFEKDTTYLKSLVATMKRIFPRRYIQGDEGQEIIKTIEGIVSPIQINTLAPSFNVKDLNGADIRLSSFKGKYVLLDFWGSWCPPCIREIPFIKKLRSDFSEADLVIIGVNNDQSLDKCRDAIKKHSMEWVHVFDEENTIQNIFGVRVYPTTILINRNGVIVYDSREKADRERLISLLSSM